MPAEFDRGAPGKFDSRTLDGETLNRWTGRILADNRSLSLPDTASRGNELVLMQIAGSLVFNPNIVTLLC